MDQLSSKLLAVVGTLITTMGAGCATMQTEIPISGEPAPRELQMASLPTYRVAPPDILLIEAVENIRPSSAPLRIGDTLTIRVSNPEPLDPGVNDDPEVPLTQPEVMEAQFRLEKEVRDKYIDGEFRIHSDGMVHLGPIYGPVHVRGLTLGSARGAIEARLQTYALDDNGNPTGISDPQVSVELPDINGKQPISGEHLVRVDGTVSLGIYGGVYVAGMSLPEIKQTVEQHLASFVEQPEVSVDVLAYNSKVYYVITDGGGFGEQVVRLPCTGNETVLDAISNIEGLSEVSSKEIWVARPALASQGCSQILPVRWEDIAARGMTATNYQLMPGDRVYVKADQMVAVDNFVAKVVAPFERIFGFVLLGNGTVRGVQFGHVNRGGGGQQNFNP